MRINDIPSPAAAVAPHLVSLGITEHGRDRTQL